MNALEMERFRVTENGKQILSFDQLKPTVNFANRMSARSNERWGPRMIPDCELVYIIAGRGFSRMGEDEYDLGPGDCVFYGPDSPHLLMSSPSDPFTYSSIHFHWNRESPEPVHPAFQIEDCLESDLSAQPVHFDIVMDDHKGAIPFPHYFQLYSLETLFLQIVEEYRGLKPGYAWAMRGLMLRLITVILRHQLSGNASVDSHKKIAPALKAIHEQPQVNWTTFELADLCGYHPTYFASLFKETTGQAPKHYVISERIRKAKYYLLEYDTIEAVALRLGYTSVHYFSRNFKEMTGLTPTEFRLRSSSI